MAMIYPLPSAAFMDRLRIQDATFTLGRRDQMTGLRGGEILTAEVAPALWGGQVSLARMRPRVAAEVQAILEALEVPGRRFHVHMPHRIGPASDPAGLALAGASPELLDVDPANPQLVRLAGLPAGFVLSAGDLLAFDYDPGSGMRRALHRVVEGVTADGTGAQATPMTVIPAVRAGAAAGAAVQLVRPSCLAALVPGTVDYGMTGGGFTSGMAFAFRQVLRA